MHQNKNKTSTKNLFTRSDQLLSELSTLLDQLEQNRLSVRQKMASALCSRKKFRSHSLPSPNHSI